MHERLERCGTRRMRMQSAFVGQILGRLIPRLPRSLWLGDQLTFLLKPLTNQSVTSYLH